MSPRGSFQGWVSWAGLHRGALGLQTREWDGVGRGHPGRGSAPGHPGGVLSPHFIFSSSWCPRIPPWAGRGCRSNHIAGHTPVKAAPEGPSLWREGPWAPQRRGEPLDCCQLPYVRFGQVLAPLNSSFLTGTMGFKTFPPRTGWNSKSPPCCSPGESEGVWNRLRPKLARLSVLRTQWELGLAGLPPGVSSMGFLSGARVSEPWFKTLL